MGRIRIPLAALLVGGTVSVAFAHNPPDEVFFAFQFPVNAVPFIDGDLSDWNMVPRDPFEISFENGRIRESVRGDAGNDPSDFSARSVWAWCEATNRIYSMAAVVDDNLNNNRDDPSSYNFDDGWQFVLDADHSGGFMFDSDWNNLPQEEARQLFYSTGQVWQIHVAPIDGYWAFAFIEGTNWMTTSRELPFPEYVEIGWSRSGFTGGPGQYTYEIKLTPWQRWDWDGPAQSTIVDLQEGGIIHCGSLFKDYDLSDERYDGDYDFPENAIWWNASRMTDVSLLPVDKTLFPTAVERDSWGRMKARFLAEN